VGCEIKIAEEIGIGEVCPPGSGKILHGLGAPRVVFFFFFYFFFFFFFFFFVFSLFFFSFPVPIGPGHEGQTL